MRRVFMMLAVAMAMSTSNHADLYAVSRHVSNNPQNPCPQGSLCYTTVRAAVNAADAGDVIIVLPGVATETR